MGRHTLVPRGTPNPDADRRFAERAFPLLEPVEWAGDRHRGGYGVSNPGSVTNSLGLVFGPWDQWVAQPRLEVTVGSAPHEDLSEPHAAFMLRPYLVADRQALQRMSWPDEEQPRRFPITIDIESTAVELDAIGFVDRWVAIGSWRTFWLFIHAIAIPPESVRLRVTERIPPR